MRGWRSQSLPSQSNTGRGWRRDVSRLRRDNICSRIPTPTDRIFVWGQKPEIYLDARQTSCLSLHHNLPADGLCFRRTDPGFRYSQPDFARRVDALSSRTLPGIRPTYIVDLYSEPGALYPVQDFPILAKLLAERYQPVARTAEGVIYRMR